MKTLNEIRPIKESVEADLLKRPGVTGVDIGPKYKDGKKTGELSIRVFVKKKKDVPAKEKIPEDIQGVKTDVIERTFELHPMMLKISDIELHEDTGTYNPLQGGISIGPCRSVYLDAAEAACHNAPGAGSYIFVGTLGAFVRDNVTNAEMMLSNFHVMCVDDTWSVGDNMAQPSRVDGGGCPGDVVGSLQRASLGGQVDCAVASHTNRGYGCSIVDIGKVAGIATATDGMAVRKRGRTTGLTYGTVDTVDLSVSIDYCNGLGTVVLNHQIGIDVDTSKSTRFGDNGDSGSVVVNDARRVVGLYFAGSSDGSYGVANPIQSVLSELNVSMCIPPYKKYEPDQIFKKREPDQIYKKYEPEQITKKREPDQYGPPRSYHQPYESPYQQPYQQPYQASYQQPYQPPVQGGGAPGGSVEERLGRIEAAVAQMTQGHFIGPENRPEVEKAPLNYETDIDQL